MNDFSTADPRPRGQSLMETLAATAADMIRPRPEQLDDSTGLAERSLEEFNRQAWHVIEPGRPLVHGWVIGCICAHLEALSALQIRDLIINVPPGSMKSLLCGVMWPAWVWIRDPGSRWIFGSYGQGLAYRDSDRTRDVIASPWYQARWGHVYQLKRSWNTKERFANTRQGYRIATTVGGKAMGERADYLCFDDPHKATEARSEAARRSVIRSWGETMSTRASDVRTVRKLIVMQRLHERDLCGHLLAEVGGYEHLVLPMEYEPRRYSLPPVHMSDGRAAPHKDAITPTAIQQARPELMDGPTGSGRAEEGDLLWPERFPLDEVERLKNTLQGAGSAGQLQQRPAAAQGSVFRAEHFRRFTIEADENSTAAEVVLGVRLLPEDPEPKRLPVSALRFFQVADTAFSAKKSAAYTCVATFAWHRQTRTLLVWHVWRAKLGVSEILPALMELHAGSALWMPSQRRWIVPGRVRPWPNPVVWTAVEEKASGIGVLQEAALTGLPLRSVSAPGDKVVKAAGVVALMAAGHVWFSAGAGWLADFEDELLTFPNSAYADQADVLSYAGLLAGEDALLNADVEGELSMWPPAPDAAGAREIDTDPALWNGDREILDVGGVEVEFNDNPNWWEDDA